MRISSDSNSDPCPVPDDVLGALYRSSKEGLPELIATVSPSVRAALALYCYRRGHLKGIGLAIASTCNEYDLMTWGGGAGAALYARSRESAAAPPAASQYVARQTITLASGSLRKSLPIVDEDIDPDDGAEENQPAEAESTEAQAAAAPDTPESEPPRSA
jgi:hypothetical protein